MINRKNRTLLLCYRKSRRYAQSRCNAVGVSCNHYNDNDNDNDNIYWLIKNFTASLWPI